MSRYFNSASKLIDILQDVIFTNPNHLDLNVLIQSISDNSSTSEDSICEYIKGPLPCNKNNLIVVCEEELEGYACIVVDNVKESIITIVNNIVRNVGFKKITLSKSRDESVFTGNNVVIEEDVSIGMNCIIEDNVMIKSGTVIGDNCIIRSNVIVGSKGYNHTNVSGVLTPLESLGGVVIGNNVEIGYNTVIAQGNIDNTIISDNVKIDALCLISHDCHVGNNVSIAASVTLCGYVEIGDKSRLAPNSTVLQRITVGEDVTVGLGAVVISNLKEHGVYFGNPAMKTKSKLIS